MTAKLKWATKHGVFVVVSTDGEVDDGEWQRLLDDLVHAKADSYLGLALGATSANPQQRRDMFAVLKTRKMPALLVTDSALTRGFVTIASWFGVNAKAFSVPEIDKAIAATGLDAYQCTDVARALRELRGVIGFGVAA